MLKKILIGLVLMAFVIVGLALPFALREEVEADTLGELFAGFHARGHRMGIDSPFNGVVLVADGDTILHEEAYGFARYPEFVLELIRDGGLIPHIRKQAP